MALKPLNSVGGFSVGEVPANVILANADITANKGTFVGNVAISNTNAAFGLLTDNLYYSNGVPWDLQEAAGSNTQIQFNNNGDFGASANFTFNTATNLLTVAGNITGANLTTAGALSVTGNANVGNIGAAAGVFTTVSGNGSELTNLNASNVSSGTLAQARLANASLTLGNTTLTLGDTVTTVAGLSSVTSTSFVGALTGAATTAGTVTTNAQPNITSVGTLTSLLVSGNANVGNLGTAGLITATGNVSGGNLTTAGLVVATGNVSGGNLTTAGVLSVTGNANVGNLGTAGLITATGNVSGGNLTTAGVLSVTGNANVGNLGTAGIIATGVSNLGPNSNVIITGGTNGQFLQTNGSGNLSWTTIVTSGVVNGTSNVSIPVADGNVNTSVGGVANVFVVTSTGANVTGYVTANGNGTFGALYSNSLTSQSGNLTVYAASGNNYVELRPSGSGHVDVGNFRIESLATPVASTDAATKQYVDEVAQGLAVQAPCAAATTDTLAVISGGTVTYNNGTAGVGATLTTTGSYTTIDGVNIATAGTRILVKNQAAAAQNGIYVYTSSTVLTRASDFNTPAEMAGGDFTFILAGTTNGDCGFVMIDPVATVGTDAVNFVQFSGAGTFTAGAGLTLTGTVFSVNTDAITTEIAGGNVVVKASAQFTTPNIGAATGTSLNLTGNVLAGNLNSNATVTAANIEVTANIIANNFTANSNITAVGLSVTGNANVGNLGTAGLIIATGNVTGGNLNTAGLVSATGNVTGGNLTTAGLVSATGNVTGGNLTTAGLVSATGNVTGGNLVTSGVASVGNLNVTANVVSDLLPNANVTHDLGATTQRWDNVYAGNIDASGNLTIAGNLSANNYTANIITANNFINVGTTTIRQGTVTTTSITANQTISSVAVSGVTGIEWIVKGIDSTGSKYSMAIVTAVTNGSTADYSTFGGVTLGSSTGTLAVNISGSDIALQVTPSSSNSTVWVTQYRTI